MTLFFSKRVSIFLAFGWLMAFCPLTQAQLECKPFKADGIYKTGEEVGWTISPSQGTAASGDWKYTVKENDWTVLQTGTLDFSHGPARISVVLHEPAMVYVQITPPPDAKVPLDPMGHPRQLALGAAVDPLQLKPDSPRPADFGQFWASKIQMLQAIPPNPVLTPKDSGRPDVDYAIIRMDHINGAHVYGQIAKPKRGGKFPAIAIFQWASPPYPLQRSWVTDRAAQGWLALNIEPHNVLPDQPRSYYEALPASLKSYQSIGIESRDTNYFLQMYLADYRAVEYLASRPDWDGKTLVVMGTSMGGQQSLCVAGLNQKVTDLIVDEPSGCDTTGPLHGRASGYPFWPASNPKVMAAAPYFDAVNFASNIHAPSMVAMGFVDTTAPPVGIWTAFDQIPAPKEAVPMIDSPHNHLATPAEQMPFTRNSARWLNILVHGGEVHPVIIWHAMPMRPQAAADEPVERMDHNSQLAHEQLLQKAHQGQIDVYFEGDSITRRWGTSDPQYADFLANWRQNFFGWNAADFGWGGDTTQNILWRLDHGELEGINPKIIVILAGTNNVGTYRPGVSVDAEASDIAKGVAAIVQTCKAKAPQATIVLMGVTPRNDNMQYMPVIDAVNEKLAKIPGVRFINLNDKLADSDGKLREGMTGSDHLHLALAGYQIWADALKPIFTEVLGAPAKTDSAPPPTGDPSAMHPSAANEH